MWPWTSTTQGTVYLLHFHAPLGNLDNPRAQARHYIGFAEDFDARLAKQLAGKGAKLVAAAIARGLTYDLYHWPAPLAVEKLIKARKRTSDYCPTCAAAAGKPVRALPVVATQLELPLDDNDFPEPPKLKMDWMEIATLRGWRASRPALAPAGIDDDLS